MSDTQKKSNEICKDFCSCLIQNNNTGLQKQVEPVLSKINLAATLEERITALKNWMENQPCITRVEAEKGLIETRTPVKVFHVYYQSGGKKEQATIDFSIEKKSVVKFSKLN